MLERVTQIMNSRAPDFVVGEPEDPYLKRWRLLPKGPWPNVYLHQFFRSDDDVLHDHPVANVSWVLSHGYIEHRLAAVPPGVDLESLSELDLAMYCQYGKVIRSREVPVGAIRARWAKTPHRVELKNFRVKNMQTGEIGLLRSSPITIFFCGFRTRDWGFWCPKGWRPWQQYIAPTSYGNRKGAGCE